MAEIFKKKYHLQHSKFAHFETLRKGFDESEPSKVPYICYQNIGFSFSLYIKFLKIYQLFCDQNIKKKNLECKRQPYFKNGTVLGEWLWNVILIK